MSQYKVLSDQQVQSFMDKGYLLVKDCIDFKLANEWIDGGYRRLGYDRHDPATWQKEIIWMKHANAMPVRPRSGPHHPDATPFAAGDAPSLLRKCHDSEEPPGDGGDFTPLPPYTPHAPPQNIRGVPPITSTPPTVLKGPMNFNRPNPAD